MRINRLLALVAIVSFLVVPSSLLASSETVDSSVIKATPSKVCHPKKPITCRAADLVTVGDAVPVSVLSVDETAKASATMNNMVCTGPKWHCRTQTLSVTPAPAAKVGAMNNMVCTGPKWHCKTQTLETSVPAAKVAAMNNMVCTGPKWHCRTQTLG